MMKTKVAPFYLGHGVVHLYSTMHENTSTTQPVSWYCILSYNRPTCISALTRRLQQDRYTIAMGLIQH